MNILILGSGGREHALAWKLSHESGVKRIFLAPGNGGTHEWENVELSIHDFEGIARFLIVENIGLLVVGPEEPLVKGLIDFLSTKPELAGVHMVGPSAIGAKLEGSKEFAKQFMNRHGIPTASFLSVTIDKIEEGLQYIQSQKPPYVLKADGLAAGKGVLIIHNRDEAIAQLQEMLHGKFGEAGKCVVIEEFLEGIEVSVFVLTDGRSWVLLPEAKDYKRSEEGDGGLNTGGMGAVSPVPFFEGAFREKVLKQVIEPTVNGLASEGIPYKGFLFFGLMNAAGNPYVIEYNCRLGDPETEAILPRIQNGFLPALLSLADQSLDQHQISFSDECATSVVVVSGGYPGDYQKELPISGLELPPEGIVFHAGTRKENGSWLTNGGRVLVLTALAKSASESRLAAVRSAGSIRFSGARFRTDIGKDLDELRREIN